LDTASQPNTYKRKRLTNRKVCQAYSFSVSSHLSLAFQDAIMLTAISASPPIRTASAFGNMNRVGESASVAIFSSSAVIDDINFTHGLFPFNLHIPARSQHLSQILKSTGLKPQQE
jgi:hypothetical protein